MGGQKRQANVNPHVSVEADSLIGAERTIRAGVIASAASNLGGRRTVVQLPQKKK